MPNYTPSKELLDLTKDMLMAVIAGRWEEASEIEQRRQRVLNELGAVIGLTGGGVPADLNDEHMREALAINSRMIDLGNKVKNELAEAMEGLSQGRKAINAYYSVK